MKILKTALDFWLGSIRIRIRIRIRIWIWICCNLDNYEYNFSKTNIRYVSAIRVEFTHWKYDKYYDSSKREDMCSFLSF